jgi:hypothetical protein
LHVAVRGEPILHALDDTLLERPPTQIFYLDVGPRAEQLAKALIRSPVWFYIFKETEPSRRSRTYGVKVLHKLPVRFNFSTDRFQLLCIGSDCDIDDVRAT